MSPPHTLLQPLSMADKQHVRVDKPKVNCFVTDKQLNLSIRLSELLPNANHHDHGSHSHDGEYKKCRRVAGDLIMLTLLVLLVILQFAVFDWYFVKYGHRHRGETEAERVTEEMDCNLTKLSRKKRNYYYIYYWIVPDLIAVAAMAMLPMMLIHQRRKPNFSAKERCRNSLANVRFGCLSWLCYALVFDAKVYLSSDTLVYRVQKLQHCLEDNEFSRAFKNENRLIFLLCCSSVIFLALILGHHTHTREANEILHSMTEVVTFDVLDAIHFYEILLNEHMVEYLFANRSVQNLIVTLTCINILLPSLSLLKIYHRLQESEKDHRRSELLNMVVDHANAVLSFLLINLPYLIIRCYFWYTKEIELSIFLLKNAIMLVVQARQIRTFSRRLWREWKRDRKVACEVEYIVQAPTDDLQLAEKESNLPRREAFARRIQPQRPSCLVLDTRLSE